MPLNYAPAEKFAWWQRSRRWVAIFILCGSTTLAMLKYGPDAAKRIKLLYLQRIALAYAAPVDWCVLDRRPVVPKGVVEKGHQSFEIRWNIPPRWADFVKQSQIGGGLPIYLASRNCPVGKPRIVFVCCLRSFGNDGELPGGGPRQVVGIGAVSYAPESITTRLEAFAHPTYIGVMTKAGLRIKVFAGQTDPLDPTHFTIDYLAGTDRGVIDGYLQRDVSITLKVRSGPGIETSIQ